MKSESGTAACLVALGLLLLAMGLAVGCGSTEQTVDSPTVAATEAAAPTVSATCRPTATPEPTRSALATALSQEIGSFPVQAEWPFHFSEDLFLLTGSYTNVTTLAAALSDTEVITCQDSFGEDKSYVSLEKRLPPLEQVGDPIELTYTEGLLGDPGANGTCGWLKDWAGTQDMVVGLYRVDQESTDEQDEEHTAASEVLVIRDMDEQYDCPFFGTVRADLVWGTGGLGGSPWTAMGSPWTPMGSPWVDALIPYTGSLDPESAFWCQWALGEPNGIGLMAANEKSEPPCKRKVDAYLGDRVRVGIFDTVPVSPSEVPEPYSQVDPPLKLTVSTVLDDLAVWPFADLESALLYPVDQHGLFVAGLVHAVAPDSEIYLYQVLNEDGWGDLHTLTKALDSFISEVKVDLDNGDIDGAVINLSLGSPLNILEYLDPEVIVKLLSEDGELTDADRDALTHWASLEALLGAAQCLDIVVVAASGNDASGGQFYFVEVPAGYPGTIGVGASSPDLDQACFSRKGIVLAPGGNGACELCQWVLDDTEACRDDCQYGLISLVTVSDEFASGYAFGAGTSFAAPLVSGLAALIVDQHDGNITAEEVLSLIEQGRCNGIVNVPRTLLGEACP